VPRIPSLPIVGDASAADVLLDAVRTIGDEILLVPTPEDDGEHRDA